MKNQWLAIRQLDNQLKAWQALRDKYGKPRAGWIKTLRVALSMSVQQLADRLKLTRGRINQLENAEAHNSITLRSLNEAANALGCELVYAIVPKGTSSLESIIKDRAMELANERVVRVAHSMSLEDQAVDKVVLNSYKEELYKTYIFKLNKIFWANNNKINNLKKINISKLITKSKKK